MKNLNNNTVVHSNLVLISAAWGTKAHVRLKGGTSIHKWIKHLDYYRNNR